MQRLVEVDPAHLRLARAHGTDRGLVYEVRELGARVAHRRRRDVRKHALWRLERCVGCMDAQDGEASLLVGQLEVQDAVEPAGARQRWIERVWPVGRRDDEHAWRRADAVHHREKHEQRLVVLLVAADGGAAGAARTERVELVDEEHARRSPRRLLEQVAHAARTSTHKDLDKV